MSGLLIVNADDYGAAPATTDAILACFERGAVSSTTTMVWMQDSERAAQLALERKLPVGLHLNLTMEFDGPSVPVGQAERQARLVRKLGARLGVTRWAYRPRLAGAIREEVQSQLARFEELYGHPPTHVDGHNHVHLSPNALRALSPGMKVRPAHDFAGRLGDSPKVLRRSWMRGRFTTPDSFVSIRSIHPRLGGSGLEDALAGSRERTVEVMVHPHWDDEYELLMSDEWKQALAGLPLGSYEDLK
jgi:predicted glycoside hydrolase/deacetylase ChbG (UPF0249 family)